MVWTNASIKMSETRKPSVDKNSMKIAALVCPPSRKLLMSTVAGDLNPDSEIGPQNSRPVTVSFDLMPSA